MDGTSLRGPSALQAFTQPNVQDNNCAETSALNFLQDGRQCPQPQFPPTNGYGCEPQETIQQNGCTTPYAPQECESNTMPQHYRHLSQISEVPVHQLHEKIVTGNDEIGHRSSTGVANLMLQSSSSGYPKLPAKPTSEPVPQITGESNAHLGLPLGHALPPGQGTTSILHQEGVAPKLWQIAPMPAWKTMGALPPKVKLSKVRASTQARDSREEPRLGAELAEDGSYDRVFLIPPNIPASEHLPNVESSKHGIRNPTPISSKAARVVPAILSTGPSPGVMSKYQKGKQLILPERSRFSSSFIVNDANGNTYLTSSSPPLKRRRVDRAANGHDSSLYTNVEKDCRSDEDCPSGILVRRSPGVTLDDFQQIAYKVRTARMPLHLQPSKQQAPSQAVQQRQMTRGTVNKNHPNPHLRGFPANHAMVDEKRGSLPPNACVEDQRLFAYEEWVKAIKRCQRKTGDNLLHGGAVRRCENEAAHISESGAAGICLACRVASHTHIVNTEIDLLDHALWPLCRPCGESALQKSDPRHEGCRCGGGWLCHSCRHSSLTDGKAKNDAEWDLRKDLAGLRCRCNKELYSPEAKADVTVLQCAGCEGVIRARWTTRQEQLLHYQFFKSRNRWAVLDS